MSQKFDRLNAGVLTPAATSTEQNNYAPTNIARGGIARLGPTSDHDITGLVAGEDGDLLLLVNVGSAVITLKDESVSSTEENRFALDRDTALPVGESVLLWYDLASTRWRAYNENIAGRKITKSTSAASGGKDGDIWFQVAP